LEQKHPLRPPAQNLQLSCSGREDAAGVSLLPLEASLPVSGAVARFVDRLTTLSAAEWEEIQVGLTNRGLDVSMLEASRNASVALAVRDMITHEQFDHLYGPFSRAIPVDSLDGALAAD
jgi:hypothetical protein